MKWVLVLLAILLIFMFQRRSGFAEQCTFDKDCSSGKCVGRKCK